MTPYRIVFFGTPDFAVPSLNILSRTGHKVQRVVTQPDRKKGRGRKMAPPPVKSAALGLGYKVLQPVSIRDAAFVEEMKRLAPDFFIVVAFGRILPGVLLATSNQTYTLAIMIASAVSIHHYFVDGCIWKISNKDVRKRLFSHLGKV